MFDSVVTQVENINDVPPAKSTLIRTECAFILNGIVYNRIHLTFCSMCALWCSSNVLNTQYSLSTWAIVGLSVTAVYQLNRISDFVEDKCNAPGEYEFNRRYSKEIIFVSLASFIILFILLLQNVILLAYSLPLLGLGLFYNFNILDSTRLKSIPVAKNITSAFGWSFATVIFPSLADNAPVHIATIVLFGYLFLGVFSSEILWDIRDMVGDNSNKIRTIPILFGSERTRMLLFLINWLAVTLIIGCILLGQIGMLWSLFIINNIASILWTSFATKLQIDRKLSHQILAIQISTLILIGIVFN